MQKHINFYFSLESFFEIILILSRRIEKMKVSDKKNRKSAVKRTLLTFVTYSSLKIHITVFTWKIE